MEIKWLKFHVTPLRLAKISGLELQALARTQGSRCHTSPARKGQKGPAPAQDVCAGRRDRRPSPSKRRGCCDLLMHPDVTPQRRETPGSTHVRTTRSPSSRWFVKAGQGGARGFKRVRTRGREGGGPAAHVPSCSSRALMPAAREGGGWNGKAACRGHRGILFLKNENTALG